MKRRMGLVPLMFVGALSLGALAAELLPLTTKLLAVNTPAASGTSSATGQTPPIFEQLDYDQDGYISQEEAKRSPEVAARFKELDSDHDGKISKAEFRAGMEAKM
jgi:hypothetical protein